MNKLIKSNKILLAFLFGVFLFSIVGIVIKPVFAAASPQEVVGLYNGGSGRQIAGSNWLTNLLAAIKGGLNLKVNEVKAQVLVSYEYNGGAYLNITSGYSGAVNPETGNKSCPAGTSPIRREFDSGGLETELYYCRGVSGVTPINYTYTGGAYYDYPNDAGAANKQTGNKSCPAGTHADGVGTDCGNRNCKLYVCKSNTPPQPSLSPSPSASPIPTPTTIPPTTIPTATPTPTPLVGDVDRNGCVGIIDFNIWLFSYQRNTVQVGTYPDVDGNGTVNLLDYNLWFQKMLTLPTNLICASAT